MKQIKMFNSKCNSLKSQTEPDSFQFDLQPDNPVEKGFKWILMLGRFIGVSPLSVSLRPNGGHLKFRWWSFSTVHSLLLAIIEVVLRGPQLWACFNNIGTYGTILEEMLGLQYPTFQLSVVSVNFYMLRNAPRLILLFQKWSSTMKKLNLTTKDNRFPSFCLKISLLVLGIGFTENILCDVYSFQKEASRLEGNTLIEKLYKTGSRFFSDYVPHYSSITSVIFIYAMKFGTYSWNFGDIFLIILCRALSYKFSQINEEIHSTLWELESTLNMKLEVERKMSISEQSFQIYLLEPSCGDSCQRRQKIWKEIREKILALCELSEEVTSFVAPFVLACYGYNIFFIILNSLRFLYDSKGETFAYVYVSTLQFAMRVVLVTYHASQVYHSTEEIFKSMERYPDSTFSLTAYRLERMLARHPVGVTIFGAVLITRKFFISILSFLFTTEIVLLQAMSAAKAKRAELANIGNGSGSI